MSNSVGFTQVVLANASSIATNVTLFVVFIGIVTAGVMKGLKDYKDFKKPAAPTAGAATSTNAQIAAATILENVTLNEWSRSNKDVVAALVRLCDILGKHMDETADLRRVVEDVRHDLSRSKP